MNRRAFLRQAALVAALGFSDAGFSVVSDRYQQAIAQPTRRKLALLVGINQYPEQVGDFEPRRSLRDSLLSGCLSDVELQRELLIYRYGFQPSDVLCLVDQEATRAAIETAFLTHLTEQARLGDVVVFHFSGLGSRVRLDAHETCRTLVPIDGVLPTEENPDINDLPEETLRLLLRSLATDQVTTILDISYGNSGKAGSGIRIRSRPSVPTGRISETARSLQQQLRQIDRFPVEQSSAQSVGQSPVGDHRSSLDTFPGVLLTAAKAGQVAAEAQWSGFSAGLFTYALTQQLWAATSTAPLYISLSRAATAIEQRVGNQQQPQLSSSAGIDRLLPYHLRAVAPAADGVVTAVEADGKILVSLPGLPASSLLTVLESGTQIQIRDRTGLKATARSVDPATLPQPGQLLQEAVRVLPRDLRLAIGFDANLERIERVDATSAFAAVPWVAPIATADQPADYLFGNQPPATAVAASLPVDPSPEVAPPRLPPIKTRYGLFQPGGTAIPQAAVEGEAVKTAVNRLVPQLRSLLALKLLRLTENGGSSRLGVKASLETIAPRTVMQQETIRAPWSAPDPAKMPLTAAVPLLPIDSQIQYRLQNYSDRSVYFALLGFDGNGGAFALYPAEGAIEGDQILPGATVTLPQTTPHASAGLAETYIIFSRAPLAQTVAALVADIAPQPLRERPDGSRISNLGKPLEVAQAVLQDLHQASEGTDGSTYRLDVNCWATLSFAYRLSEAMVSDRSEVIDA